MYQTEQPLQNIRFENLDYSVKICILDSHFLIQNRSNFSNSAKFSRHFFFNFIDKNTLHYEEKVLRPFLVFGEEEGNKFHLQFIWPELVYYGIGLLFPSNLWFI